MTAIYDEKAKKKTTTLTVNSELLQLAKDQKINISGALEHKLKEIIIKKQEELWRSENREAIDEYNRRIASEGVFSEGLRGF